MILQITLELVEQHIVASSLVFILQIVLLETTAPLDTPIVLEQIPADMNWKFECNFDSGAPRYWVKLKSRDGIRYHCILDNSHT